MSFGGRGGLFCSSKLTHLIFLPTQFGNVIESQITVKLLFELFEISSPNVHVYQLSTDVKVPVLASSFVLIRP